MASDQGFWSLRRWLTTTNHKDIGMMYMSAALFFGLIGGLLAVGMRIETMTPANDFLGPVLGGILGPIMGQSGSTAAIYSQFVTVHGLVMLLWFAGPLGTGFANYLVPLKIGTRDLAFPRLNALSFWMFFFGGLVAAAGFVLPTGAIDTGWTMYGPINQPGFSSTIGTTVGAAGGAMVLASTILGTVNFLATMAVYRTKGMTPLKMPIFVWFWFATMLLALWLFPEFGAAGLMLVSDRLLDSAFFDAPHGSLLYDNLFWIFGHPEVYVLLFPGLGVIGEVIETFSRRPIWGKKIVVGNLMIGTAMSMVVWGHHMYITGVQMLWREWMSIWTELISIPFGVITIAYILTMLKGKIKYKTPMLFALGGTIMFSTLGGPTGVFNSSAALDYQIRGTYWVLAHFHFVLVPAVAMGLIAGLYFWFPKMTGKMYSERVGVAHFVGTVLGVSLTYIPMFVIRATPRRTAIYAADAGGGLWAQMNFYSGIGAVILAAAQILMIYNFWISSRRGGEASSDPFGSWSLEWTQTSPPPEHSFEKMPVITESNEVVFEDFPEGHGADAGTDSGKGSRSPSPAGRTFTEEAE